MFIAMLQTARPPRTPTISRSRTDVSGLPPAEARAQRITIQLIAVLALALSLAYLTWRVGFTLGSDLWISVPLWLLEAHTAVGLGLFTFSLWNVDGSNPPSPVELSGLQVAVLIATFNEPDVVLLPTIAAAVALEPGHETWVLDDGHRTWVRDLAENLGAHYLTRPDNQHAKAGNLNHALSCIDADVVAVLDADHVAAQGFLTHTLGYFVDPKVAVVQTPQDFYNVDSFEHDRNRSWFWRQRRSITYNEQRLFYRAIQAGKNYWGGAFWCGTNALVRVAALRDVGGVAYETVTEDIHTTIRMHRRGWKSVYHNEVLAFGLAARDATQYQAQRIRWGTGAMQVLHLEHPLLGPGLSLGQRLSYAGTLLGWFDAWRTLGFVLVPLAVIFSGANPIHAPAVVFLVAFGATFLVQRLAIALLSRGYAPQGMATIFEFVRMQSNITATLSYLWRGERSFRVTAKGASDGRHRNRPPMLLVALVLVTVAAIVWFTCVMAGIGPITYEVRWIAYGAAFWMCFNGALLVAAMARIRSERFATDRRSSVRLKLGRPARIDGAAAEVLDISVGGCLVRCDPAPASDLLHHELRINTGGHEVLVIEGSERSRQHIGQGGALIGLQFDEGQEWEIAQLSASVIRGQRVKTRWIATLYSATWPMSEPDSAGRRRSTDLAPTCASDHRSEGSDGTPATELVVEGRV